MKHIAMLVGGLLAGALAPAAQAQENEAEKLFRGMEKKLLAAAAFEVTFDRHALGQDREGVGRSCGTARVKAV